MIDYGVLIIGGIFIVLGWVGCFLPVLPGPPVSFLGLLALRFTAFVPESGRDSFDRLLWITAAAALLAVVVDNLVPVWGARKFGASRAGMVGAALGLVAGFFFPPLGLIVGPFLGAVAGELLSGKDRRLSFRAGAGSFLGFLGGIVLKLAVSGVITFFFVREIVF